MKQVYPYIPLCWLDNGRLLACNRKAQLLVHHLQSDEQICIGALPISAKEKVMMRCTLTARAMRLVNFTCTNIDENRVLVAFRGTAYLVDTQKKTVTAVFTIDKGKRPLFFCFVKNKQQKTQTGIYYGDYCTNTAKNPINIYRINPDTFEKEIVYTFPQGRVNHIHNIVYDASRDCLWIFTGDFDDAAAIWRTDDNFASVQCVLKGDQNYRADVVTIYDKDIWYATDSPFAPNYLIRLYQEGKEWKIEKAASLNGPVIYGGKMGEKLVFSTDVESDGTYRNRWECLTSRKLGKGIKDYYAYLYVFDLKNKELSIIHKCKKDLLPFVVFQFGAIMFPDGECDGSIIPAFHVALNKHPLKTLLLNSNPN